MCSEKIRTVCSDPTNGMSFLTFSLKTLFVVRAYLVCTAPTNAPAYKPLCRCKV